MAPTQAQSQSQKQDVSDWSSPFPVESVSTKSKWMLASHSSPCILGNPPACHDGISGRTPAPRRLATCQIENHRKSPAAATRCVIAELRAGNCCTAAAKDVKGCGRMSKDVCPKWYGFLHSRPRFATSTPITLLSSALVGECNKSWTGKTMTNVLSSATHFCLRVCYPHAGHLI